MNGLARALANVTVGLVRARYAVVGGIAVSARIEPRFTRDLDSRSQCRTIRALRRSCETSSRMAAQADQLEVFAGVPAPVAQSGHLIALKVLARDDRTRPQAAVDLRALIAAAGESDLALARQSVRLIEQRGFHRGRDLVAALEAAQRDFGR